MVPSEFVLLLPSRLSVEHARIDDFPSPIPHQNVARSTAPEVHAKIERRIGTGEAVSAAAMQAGEEVVAAVIVFLR